MKSNLLHLYKSDPLNSNFYNSCPQQDKTFKKFLYSLSFFDAIVNERKKYGCMGWNVPYNFNKSDFVHSVQQMQMFLCNDAAIPFDTFEYIIGICFYGGRVLEEYDQRLLQILLKDYLNKNLIEDPLYRLSDAEYALPRRFEHRMIVSYINETILNGESHFELYGLHANSDFIYKLKTSNKMLSSMVISEKIESSASRILVDENETFHKLAAVIDKLPTPINVEATSQSKSDTFGNSLNAVRLCEITKYNRLLMIIRTTCVQLQHAIKGKI